MYYEKFEIHLFFKNILTRYSLALDTTSSIKRLVPSYQKRNITKRVKLSNGTELSSAYYGPDVFIF
jgi:hypothetical protein